MEISKKESKETNRMSTNLIEAARKLMYPQSGVVAEKLDPKADAEVWIDDFVKSKDPKFKGKSKEERIDMALGAYYAARKKAGLEEFAEPRTPGMNEETGDKEEYQKFFNKTLKKYGADSPADLSDADKKKFYDEIDRGWKGDDEENVKEAVNSLDARKKEFREKLRKLAYAKGKTITDEVADEEGDKKSPGDMGKEMRVQRDEATGAVSVVAKRNGVNEGKKDYEIYHDSYTSALNAVQDFIKKNGFEMDEDEWFTKVSTGPKRPSEGKTNRFTLPLMKGGKESRRVISFQVYGMGDRYELNMYIG